MKCVNVQLTDKCFVTSPTSNTNDLMYWDMVNLIPDSHPSIAPAQAFKELSQQPGDHKL